MEKIALQLGITKPSIDQTSAYRAGGSRMKLRIEDQFESLESAHSFVTLLGETVAEAKNELECDLVRESADSRRRDALRIAQYNLAKLELHVNRSRRILNDLRTLRRLLFEERGRTRPEKTNNEPNTHCVAA